MNAEAQVADAIVAINGGGPTSDAARRALRLVVDVAGNAPLRGHGGRGELEAVELRGDLKRRMAIRWVFQQLRHVGNQRPDRQAPATSRRRPRLQIREAWRLEVAHAVRFFVNDARDRSRLVIELQAAKCGVVVFFVEAEEPEEPSCRPS